MDVKQAISSIRESHRDFFREKGRWPELSANLPTDVVEPGEIVGERTKNARVFPGRVENERTAKVYPFKIHWWDGFSYKTIDPTVKRKPLGDPLQSHQYEVKSGIYHAHFKEDKPWDYRLEVGDSFVEYEAQFEASESLDIQVETSKVGIKETITLIDDRAPVSLSWRVTKSEGESAIITPPPTAKDVNSKDVPVRVSQEEEILTYDLDVTGAVFPIIVDPTSIVATNDGSISANNTDYTPNCYLIPRNATTGSHRHDLLYIGQEWYDYGEGIFGITIHRPFLSFAIPDMLILLAASLFGYTYSQNAEENFNIYILGSTYNNPMVDDDFNNLDGWQESGAYTGIVLNNAWSTSSWVYHAWMEITFGSAGFAAIFAAKSSTLKLALISKEDYDNSEPTISEYVIFNSSATSGKEPYLSLTYTVVVSPTVTTQAATNVTATSCTGNGNITDTGGENGTRQGFCYKVGTSGDPTTADSVAYTDGSFGTGAFTKSITGLSPATGYRVRAYQVNSAGTGYGDTVQVTTTITISTSDSIATLS